MTRLILSACTVALGATLTMSAWCAAENVTTINLLSPRNGDTVVLRRMDPPRRRGRA